MGAVPSPAAAGARAPRTAAIDAAKAIARPLPASEAFQTFRCYVQSPEVEKRLLDVASKYLSPAELARCVLLAATREPKILSCTRDSVLRCMAEAAVLGIRPGGINGRGWLIPRWNKHIKAHELCFDPGYRGLADVARRSRVVRRIEARVVHERDHFRIVQGTEPRLEHEPYDGPDDPGAIRAAYAVAFLPEGQTHFEVVWRRDLERIRACSEAADAAARPWHDWPDEMSRKTAVRRLCKHLPVDEELEYALEVATLAERAPEAEGELEADPDPVAGGAAAPSRAGALADRLRARAAAADSERAMDVGDDPGDLGP